MAIKVSLVHKEFRATKVLLVEKEKMAYLGLMGRKGSQEMMHKDHPVLQVQKVAALMLSIDYAFVCIVEGVKLWLIALI